MEQQAQLLKQALNWINKHVSDPDQLPEPLRSEIRSMKERRPCPTWSFRELDPQWSHQAPRSAQVPDGAQSGLENQHQQEYEQAGSTSALESSHEGRGCLMLFLQDLPEIRALNRTGLPSTTP